MRDSLITLTVYFSGTGGKILDSSGLHGYLFQHTHEDDLYQRHGLDGCGITHGVLGVYFGRGVEEHAKKVYQKVLELLKEGKRVRLNCFGYSRGAISALLLAKMLGDYPMDRVEVNLALADPVPGNLFFQVKMDLLSTTLANKAMNFSECKNLNKILVLYVNDPRPNQYGECPEFIISAHAPLFPVYPLFTATERVIIPGCHNGMMWTHYKQAGDEFLQGEEKQQIYSELDRFLKNQDDILAGNAGAYISTIHFVRFLTACGTKFNFNPNGRLMFSDDEEFNIYLQDLKAIDLMSDEATNVSDLLSLAHDTETQKIEKETQRLCHTSEGPGYISTRFESDNEMMYFSMSEQRPVLANRVSIDCQNVTLFKKFLKGIEEGMSCASADSMKGIIMRRYIDQVKHMDYFVEKAQSMAALRNSLALALQCTGVEITGSYVTNTGKSALKMLKDPEFSSLKAMIMGSSGKDLTYSDLRKFVIGMELEKYFSKSRSEKLYARLGKDRYFLHTDHNFVRDSLGGVSSVVIEVDTDFENIKGELVRIMNGYISSYKLSLFGHHHNKRAIAVKTAVLSCCTLEEITAIIENQRSIFAKPLIVDEPGLIASFKLETEGKGSLKASDEIKDIPLLRTRWKSVRNVSSSSGYRKMLEAAWSFVSAKSLVVDPLTVGVVPS